MKTKVMAKPNVFYFEKVHCLILITYFRRKQQRDEPVNLFVQSLHVLLAWLSPESRVCWGKDKVGHDLTSFRKFKSPNNEVLLSLN